jgi:hypothetical protein
MSTYIPKFIKGNYVFDGRYILKVERLTMNRLYPHRYEYYLTCLNYKKCGNVVLSVDAEFIDEHYELLETAKILFGEKSETK